MGQFVSIRETIINFCILKTEFYIYCYGAFDGFIYLPGGRLEGGNESSESGEERFNPLSFAVFRIFSFLVSLS